MFILQTDRLILRPFEINDAPRVQELAGVIEVAETTLSIPYPYTLDDAKFWIERHPILIEKGDVYPFAITVNDELIGTMSLHVDKQHKKGELAYWIGKEYWGKGFASEAAKKLLEFGFNELKLNRIWAKAMSKNKASTKVMDKIGMKYEGTIKQDILKWDKYENTDIYGILKNEYVG